MKKVTAKILTSLVIIFYALALYVDEYTAQEQLKKFMREL